MNNKTSDKVIVTKEDLEVLEERIFHYEINKKIGTVDKMVPGAVKENEAIKHLLAEQEQKDKRIKELEEESRKKSIELICYQEELENNIPKQVVIDKIKEYDKKMEEDAGHPNWVITDRIVMNVLQELLEGGK